MAVIDVTDAIVSEMGEQSFSIERKIGAYEKGTYVQQDIDVKRATGIIQPTDNNIINELGIEGWYKKKFIKIYSANSFKVTDDAEVGDFVIHNDLKYVVRMVDDWDYIGGYTVAVAELYG